jgi:hypothetical protein
MRWKEEGLVLEGVLARCYRRKSREQTVLTVSWLLAVVRKNGDANMGHYHTR